MRPGHLRRHRRPGPQEADAGGLRPGQPRAAAAGLRAGRLRPARLGRPGLRARSSTTPSSEHARTPFREEVWQQLAEGFRFVPGDFDDDERLRPARRDGRRARPGARHRRQPRVLPVDPAEVLPRRRASSWTAPAWPTPADGAWRRVVIEKPFGHDLKSARELNDDRRARSSRRTRSSGSTTTWARRRSRTSWRCASPTSCSSRSGTPTTSTTCRSPWPRTSASAAGPATTTASAPPATSSRTTCCSCWR